MDVDEVITALSRLLEEPYQPHRKTPKAPNGFDKELQGNCNPQHQRRSVLLDVGFQAWFAYFLAEPRVQAGVDGLPDSEQQAVARHICSIKPHPTVENLFQHIFYHAFRAESRRAVMDEAGYRYPERQNVLAPGRAASPASSAASLQMENLGETHAGDQHTQPEQPRPPSTFAHANNAGLPPLSNNADPGIRLPPLLNSMHQGIGLPPLGERGQGMRALPPVDDRQPARTPPEMSCPDAKNVPLLFPPQIYASVVIRNRVAAIRASLTDVPCSIEVDILPSRIQYIARELFGALIEIDNGYLSWFQESGVRVSFDTITLHGADRQAAHKTLGTFFKFISTDSQYCEEIEEGKYLTDLISFKLSGRAGNPGCLKVRATAQTITKISAKLWPSSFPSPPS